LSNKKRDDSYFAAGRRKNRKYMMIIIPVIAAIVAIGVAAAVMAPRGTAGGFGALGSAHEHAVFEVRLEGEPIDLSQFIHVEGGDGTTLHRHSTGVPVGEFFRSVDMNIDEANSCFVSDDGMQYCDNDSEQLRFFVNGTEVASIANYILKENDRILIIYGSETQEQLQAAFDKLNTTPIQG
jgi:hypothetical protein